MKDLITKVRAETWRGGGAGGGGGAGRHGRALQATCINHLAHTSCDATLCVQKEFWDALDSLVVTIGWFHAKVCGVRVAKRLGLSVSFAVMS